MKEMMKNTGIVVLVCLIFSLFIIIFTPYPVASLIKGFFTTSSPAKEPEDYATFKDKIQIEKNLTYASLLGNNQFDLVKPKTKGPHPVIVWIHGGAYVGGDKEDVAIYSNLLAAQGYAVANMNYELAPKSRYPGPLIQVSDLVQELQTQESQYDLDMTRVFIAGDSAGAQLASQFVNIQLDKRYSQTVGIPNVLEAQTVRGVLLYSGVFSLSQMGMTENLSFLNFMTQRIGWAYTGQKEWQKSPQVMEADGFENISVTFPPTFITDGNKNTFTTENKQFLNFLETNGTVVEGVFYSLEEATLPHEYQFDLTLPQAQQTYQATVNFLEKQDQ